MRLQKVKESLYYQMGPVRQLELQVRLPLQEELEDSHFQRALQQEEVLRQSGW
jgi:hypothetical protein